MAMMIGGGVCGKSCLCQLLSGEWLWLDAHTYIHITHLYLTRSAYQSTRLYQLPYTDHARGLVGGCFSSRRKDHWCATLILLLHNSNSTQFGDISSSSLVVDTKFGGQICPKEQKREAANQKSRGFGFGHRKSLHFHYIIIRLI